MKPFLLKTRVCRVAGVTGLVLIGTLTTWARMPVDTLRSNLTAYASSMDQLSQQANAAGTNPPPILIFLTTCRDNAQWVATQANLHPRRTNDLNAVLTELTRRLESSRSLADAQLRSAGLPPRSQYPAAWAGEGQAYEQFVGPYTNDSYRIKISNQNELLRRKYLEPDDPQANYVETLAQDFSFTRYDGYRRNSWRSYKGVSPLEVKLRLEPAIALGSSATPALLLSGGLLYNFFPTFDDSGRVKETTYSQFVRRTGPCLGGGIGYHNGSVDPLLGGGWQVRWFTVWMLYDTASRDYSFGVGISEWDWVKKTLPSGMLDLFK